MNITDIDKSNVSSLKKGIEEFGIKGRNSVLKEMQQLHDIECFKPIAIETLTQI